MGSFSILNNLSSLAGQVNLSNTAQGQAKTIQALSSGLRINSAGDDAAGLAVANQFRSDITGLNQGIRNANDGVSSLQVVDSGLQGISTLLDRARTLATQSASDTFQGDRTTLDNEFQKVLSEIDRQASAIGLGNGAGFNNTSNNISENVFIGGGKAAANAGTNSNDNEVNIDLSGASNLVDSASLGLSTSSNGVTSGSALNVGAALGAGASLTIAVTSGNSQNTFTVDLSAAASNNDVVSAINQAAGGSVTASINSSGELQLSSNQTFTAEASNAAVTTATGISHSAAVASAATASNSDILSSADAKAALTAIDSANTALGKVIGVVGAGENRLQQAINLANSQVVNFTASESDIRDANIAQEATNLTKFSVLQQSGIAALAQSNQSSSAILALLK